MSGNTQKGTDNHTGCLVCGQPLAYSEQSRPMTCHICKRPFESNAACTAGHFICDSCHTATMPDFKSILPNSTEKDPIRLFEWLVGLPGVHMHGPEHHIMVPCIMLTAYRNNGGDIDLATALEAATKRGKKVPGGACGYWGACGAAIGAGIYASVLTGASPLSAQVMGLPQALVSECLGRMSQIGGPRCCKRMSRIALEAASEFTGGRMGVKIETTRPACAFPEENKECLYGPCPYYAPASLHAAPAP